MTDSALRIGVILASVRPARRGEAFAHWIKALVAERPGTEVELLDLKDYPIGPYAHAEMPGTIEQKYEDPVHRRWSEKIHGLDAYVIVTPEYCRGYPGQLKNAIDHVHTGWWYKPVAFVSYGGGAGGARAVEHLRCAMVDLRTVPVRGEVNVRLIGLELDDSQAPKDPFYGKAAKALVDQLLWWTRATKHARGAEQPPGF